MHPRKTRRYRESYYGWWRTRSSSSRKCQLGSRDSDTRKSCMNRACMFFVRLACTQSSHVSSQSTYTPNSHVNLIKDVYAQLTSYFPYNTYLCTIYEDMNNFLKTIHMLGLAESSLDTFPMTRTEGHTTIRRYKQFKKKL